jgi:hypothetical protein
MSKKSVSTEAKPAIQAMQILLVQVAESLSKRSLLTYHVGQGSDGQLYVRLWENSGTGIFSRAWVAYSAIEEKLAQLQEEESINGRLFASIYRSKSANNPAFLLAICKDLGIVTCKTPRTCQKADPQPFLDRMAELSKAGTNLEIPEPAKPERKSAGKAKGATPKIDTGDQA